ncbi:hypothetical protein H4R20_001205 [Coemansia guatemalensis]|uniref:Uncharacterized protein n=1 Tax=Coemansia guatemalensis TaxID=2761395 RepID=A0A9W8LUR2_9FUNG|nr:hypothetical protein H4R20_001205 [Coemansia guatemalensis]
MTECLAILGELRQLVYEWKYQLSQSKKSAGGLLTHHTYLQVLPQEHTRLRGIQLRAIEERLSELQRDLRAMVRISRQTIALSTQAALALEPKDGYQKVLGITPSYTKEIVSRHAEDYERVCSALAEDMRRVIDTLESKPLAENWLKVDFLVDDFEERMLLLGRAQIVRSTREEEKRLGLSS